MPDHYKELRVGTCRASGNITAGDLIAQIRMVAEQKAFAGLILRVDSPGGSHAH